MGCCCSRRRRWLLSAMPSKRVQSVPRLAGNAIAHPQQRAAKVGARENPSPSREPCSARLRAWMRVSAFSLPGAGDQASFMLEQRQPATPPPPSMPHAAFKAPLGRAQDAGRSPHILQCLHACNMATYRCAGLWEGQTACSCCRPWLAVAAAAAALADCRVIRAL